MSAIKEKIEGSMKLGKRGYAKRIGKRSPEKYSDYLENPIFIIGCGRSGTSMLTRILEDHKEICNYSEANDVWDPLGYPWYSSDLKRPPIWFDPDTYIKVWRDYFDEKYEQELRGIFGCFQSLNKTKHFLNKSPMNTLRISDILRMFPDAKIINIIRDGRAVAYSWAVKQEKKIKEHEKIFESRNYNYPFNDLVLLSLKSWIYHMKEVEYQKGRDGLLNSDNFLEFTYSDFSKEPEIFMDNICKFLNIKKDGFNNLDLSRVKNYNFKWRDSLDGALIEKMETILRDDGLGSKMEIFLSD